MSRYVRDHTKILQEYYSVSERDSALYLIYDYSCCKYLKCCIWLALGIIKKVIGVEEMVNQTTSYSYTAWHKYKANACTQ